MLNKRIIKQKVITELLRFFLINFFVVSFCATIGFYAKYMVDNFLDNPVASLFITAGFIYVISGLCHLVAKSTDWWGNLNMYASDDDLFDKATGWTWWDYTLHFWDRPKLKDPYGEEDKDD